MSSPLRVGFVGLGSQGGPMARRIAEEGFPTTLWARRPESFVPFEDTPAQRAGSLRDLGGASDVLCVCVVADADVDQVLRGDDGALAGMSPGGIVVVHSTVHPDTCRRLQADHPALHVLDAPVSGGGHMAAARELLVMVGGPAEVLDRCRPVLEAFADPLLHLGGLGAGQEAKLLNNALFTAQLGLAADVFELARARDLDPAAMATVLAHGSGRSYAAEVVARSGIEVMGQVAGPLLAKDAGIVAELVGPTEVQLLDAARAALTAMRIPREEPQA
jgi:3-hydroxyisobutyrate dehydrogenase-like beta-hydroxyacid dehydrogenase